MTAWEQLTGGYTAYSLNTTFNHNSTRYVQKLLEEETITVEGALRDLKKQLVELERAESELEDLFAREGLKL